MREFNLEWSWSRFIDKVKFMDSCWEWQGATSGPKRNYGIITLNKEQKKAYRFAYEICVGPIPDGLTIDHLCRNPLCVNPDHLEPVTHAENCRRAAPYHYHKQKTHCPQGHEYSEENTYVWRGGRACRACKRIQYKQRRIDRGLPTMGSAAPKKPGYKKRRG